MEKYRKYADAATGINPFVTLRTPTMLSVAVAAILFPLRLVAALLFAVVLFPLDMLAYFFFILPGFSFVSRLLLAPCQRGLIRGLLLSLGNISVTREAARGVTHATTGDASPAAEHVVVANLQSVWDMCALEVAGKFSLFLVAFYAGGSACTTGNRKVAGEGMATLVTMEPSPLQRWRVWWHIYGTGSLGFLRSAMEGNNDAVIDVTHLQQRSRRLGVPLVLFAEGTCTNGRGVLRMNPLRINASLPHAQFFVAALDYDTSAVQTVLRPRHVLSCLFAMSSSLHGSRDPAWYSPLFPTVTVRVMELGTAVLGSSATAACGSVGAGAGALLVNGGKVCHALCSASRSRRALAVGIREKSGYAEACMRHASGGGGLQMREVKET